jgi:hypothetical protein
MVLVIDLTKEISMTNDVARFTPKSRVGSGSQKKRSSRAFWIKTLVAFSESRLSVQEFCRLNSLATSSFYAWRKRLRHEESHSSIAPATFVPLEVMPDQSLADLSSKNPQIQHTPVLPVDSRRCCDSGLSLQLNEGLNIRIDKEFHEPTLQRLVQIFTAGAASQC